MTKIIEIAPAKINLTLDVLGKRPDGYHDVRMVMQSISLADTLILSESERIQLSCSNSELPTDERNLAVKAAQAILNGTGKGINIHLQKNIPLEAGMAGGSSDAAAVLRGINKIYGLGKSEEELLQMAVTLGADVSFCLRGGTALAEGIGERLTPLASPPRLWLVLVKPYFGVSTALVYKSLELNSINKHPDTDAMLDAIKKGDVHAIILNLSNVLESVTLKLKPELCEVKQQLMELGAENVLMSGSGPTIFGVFLEEHKARTAANNFCMNQGSIFVAHTL